MGLNKVMGTTEPKTVQGTWETTTGLSQSEFTATGILPAQSTWQ